MLPPLPRLLAELVRIPSVNPMGRTDVPAGWCLEHRVTDYLEAHLRALGVPCERQQVAPGRCNLVARYVPPTLPPFTLLFEAHQDTVPTDGMTVEPFTANTVNGRMYGRGSCDVKAGVAAMLAAFARLVTEKPPGSAAVTLAFTVDEEHTFLGVQHLARSGITADFAVVAEPTGLDIVRAHLGVARWTLETAGVACHSSAPQNGVNAIYRMARVVDEVERYASDLAKRPPDPALGLPQVCVGLIQGGISPNAVPDWCRVHVDRRMLPGETAAGVVDELSARLRARPDVNFDVAPTLILDCPPLAAVGGDAFVARLAAAIDDVTGSHRVTVAPYGTDASTIQEAGIPAVVFGPGDIAQAHTKDEWIELAEVETASEVLYRFAARV